MDNLNPEVYPVLEYYKDLENRLKRNSSSQLNIKVGDTFSSVASFYERVRYTIDYKKEHLLRRNAIERILKRLLWEKGEDNVAVLAETLLKELIWARYIKNDYYPVTKIEEIAGIISKYLILARDFASRSGGAKEPKWKDWLIAVSSCEIEENLDPTLTSVDILSMAAESWFTGRYEWKDTGLGVEDKKDQLAIAIHRSLLRGDEPKNAYYLLRRLHKNWNEVTLTDIEKNRDEIYLTCRRIRASLANPIQAKLYRFIQKQVSAFQILKNLIEQDPERMMKIIANPSELSAAIFGICEERYNEIRNRVNRGIVRSVIYIFITKILFAIAIEIPYEHYFIGRVSILPLVSTIIIPILFVFLVTATIRRPGEENTQKITEIIFDFIFKSEGEPVIGFSLANQKRGLTYKVFSVVYGLVFLLVFSLISFVLTKAGYDFVGIGIFFVFLSLILLFGYRVKFAASELSVTGVKEGLASDLLTNVSLPFLDLGVWLADKFASLNFFILLFDFLVEAPLKNILGILDAWTTFLKERKEEATETPVER